MDRKNFMDVLSEYTNYAWCIYFKMAVFSVSVCEYRFRDTLEFDCLLSGADNVICCPHQERKLKNVAFAKTFATFPVSLEEACLV